MRIYMLGAEGFPADTDVGGGGVERHVEELATRLAARGHDVFVYVDAHSTDPALEEYRGVNIIRLPSVPFFATLHVLFQRADIIHYHGTGPSVFSFIPRIFKGRSRIISTFHNRDSVDPKRSWFARTYQSFGEWASVHFPHKTIVVSHVLQVYCRKLYGLKTVYIPNGSSLGKPQGTDILQTLKLKPDHYFLSVGSLVPNKAYDQAIEAYAKIKTSFPLVIVGDVEDSTEHIEKLKRLAKKDPRIRFIGSQTGAALQQLLGHCYAFVHPSRVEGLSEAVLAAMTAGKVVILSDIKENLELVDQSGIAYPLDDRAKLREAMEWSLRNPDLMQRRGLRACEVVRSHYAWSVIVKRLEHVYRNDT